MSKLKEQYIAALQKYNVCNDELLTILGDDLFESPASTATNLHNAYPGGLVDHMLKVASQAVKLNQSLDPEEQSPLESILRVALLAEIGKVRQYKELKSKWHNDKGIMYEFTDNRVSMRVGQRSIYYINQAGIKLTEDEYQAILNHDVQNDDMITWHAANITRLLRHATEWAIVKEKRIAKS